jgi:hypothetical protein
MITKENYLNHISYQETLETRAYEVANLLNKLNSKMWPMFAESGEFYFYDDSVSLNTHDYFRGSYDSTSMDFNPLYLNMTDDEITIDAKRIIEEADEKARQIKEAKDKLITEQVEEKERKEYLRLKWKYDSSN